MSELLDEIKMNTERLGQAHEALVRRQEAMRQLMMMWGVPVQSSPPDKEPQKEQEWAIRDGVPHWADSALPAGQEAYSDYRGHDRRLTRKPVNEMAKPIHVAEPIGAGDRVKVEKMPSGTYEARRA